MSALQIFFIALTFTAPPILWLIGRRWRGEIFDRSVCHALALILVLAYFGEASETCGNCDLCQEGVERFDGTIDAQKAMSAILRTGERFVATR